MSIKLRKDLMENPSPEAQAVLADLKLRYQITSFDPVFEYNRPDDRAPRIIRSVWVPERREYFTGDGENDAEACLRIRQLIEKAV